MFILHFVPNYKIPNDKTSDMYFKSKELLLALSCLFSVWIKKGVLRTDSMVLAEKWSVNE